MNTGIKTHQMDRNMDRIPVLLYVIHTHTSFSLLFQLLKVMKKKVVFTVNAGLIESLILF